MAGSEHICQKSKSTTLLRSRMENRTELRRRDGVSYLPDCGHPLLVDTSLSTHAGEVSCQDDMEILNDQNLLP
jgi:hypothetical protein